MIDVSHEISFQTTRSGGKGGQNVNKVETAVFGSFDINGSSLLTGDQKKQLLEKLSNRLNADGLLQVRSQVHRTQLANKEEVVEKINRLLEEALKKKKQGSPPALIKVQKRSDWNGKKEMLIQRPGGGN